MSKVADSWDSRQFPDPIDGNRPIHQQPKGCTCMEGHKLDCPVHGLNAPTPDWEGRWSLPENSPVNYPQDQPRSWQIAESSVTPSDHNLDNISFDNGFGLVLDELPNDNYRENKGHHYQSGQENILDPAFLPYRQGIKQNHPNEDQQRFHALHKRDNPDDWDFCNDAGKTPKFDTEDVWKAHGSSFSRPDYTHKTLTDRGAGYNPGSSFVYHNRTGRGTYDPALVVEDQEVQPQQVGQISGRVEEAQVSQSYFNTQDQPRNWQQAHGAVTSAIRIHEIGKPSESGEMVHGTRRPFSYFPDTRELLLGPHGGDHGSLIYGDPTGLTFRRRQFDEDSPMAQGGLYRDKSGQNIVEFYYGTPEQDHIQEIANALGANRVQLHEWHPGGRAGNEPDRVWDFNSKKASGEIEPWEPGKPGKAIYWPNEDKFISWSGPQHHADLWMTDPTEAHHLDIYPDGRYVDEGVFGGDEGDDWEWGSHGMGADELAQAIRSHDPRLIPVSSRGQWDFGPTEPMRTEPDSEDESRMHNVEISNNEPGVATIDA